MNLENSIKDCISKELEKGIVEKVIASKLEECISSALKDMFSWSGEVKKVIDEKVKSVMIPYLDKYDYSQYICKLDAVLVEVLNNTALENKKLLENFKELMTSDENLKNVKITDIYKKWCDHCVKEIDKDKIDGYDYEGGYINTSLEIEEVSKSWSDYEKHIVRFECEEDEDLNVEFMLTRWKKYDRGHKLEWKKTNELKSLRYLCIFDMFMMKVDQAYADIEIDEDCSSDEILIEHEE
jgi:hypothetical protein